MKKFALIFASALALGFAGCFMVDLSNATYSCAPSQSDGCPDGLHCSSQNICVAGGAVDLATGSSPPPTTEAEGCPLAGASVGMGFLVSPAGKPKVFACPGKYKSTSGMTADVQCRAPYALCTTATNVDFAACSKAGQYMNGFFIANVAANKKFGSSQVSCGTAAQGFYSPLWAGCGRAATTLSCSGFTAGQECSTGGNNGLQCSGTKLGDLTNSDSASGVLCCSP